MEPLNACTEAHKIYLFSTSLNNAESSPVSFSVFRTSLFVSSAQHSGKASRRKHNKCLPPIFPMMTAMTGPVRWRTLRITLVQRTPERKTVPRLTHFILLPLDPRVSPRLWGGVSASGGWGTTATETRRPPARRRGCWTTVALATDNRLPSEDGNEVLLCANS